MVSRLAVVAVVACVAVLAGCAPAPAPDPMNDQLRSAIRQDRADTAWQAVSEEYPEALRPKITVGPVRDDYAWATDTRKCFADEGFVVVRNGSTFEYSSSQGQSPLQFAVAQYHCEIAVPSLAEIAGYLDVYQLGDLYDYFVDRVQPCLALNGAAIVAPPTREAFESGYGSTQWTPFAAIENRKPNARRVAELQQLCPPVPGWLHL